MTTQNCGTASSALRWAHRLLRGVAVAVALGKLDVFIQQSQRSFLLLRTIGRGVANLKARKRDHTQYVKVSVARGV